MAENQNNWKELFKNQFKWDFKEHLWSFIGTVLGLGLIAYLQTFVLNESDHVFLIGSFGASSVLLYAAAESPLSQPRNLLGGHLISAIIGVSIVRFLPEVVWITAPLSVALAIVAMQITKTLHPPGGATALIAVIGSSKLKALGFTYVLFPVLSGSVILLVVALFCNNIAPNRKYPVNINSLLVFKKVFKKK